MKVLRKIGAGMLALPLVLVSAAAYRVHALTGDWSDAIMDWGWGDRLWHGEDPAND